MSGLLKSIVATSTLILTLGLHNAKAQEYRTISVFSPVNATNFVAGVRKLGLPNSLSTTLSTQMNSVLNVDEAAKLNDVKPTDGNVLSSVVKPPPNVTRRNVVIQNTAQLNAALESAQANPNIVPVLSLDLFDDVHLKITTQSIKKLPNGTLSIAGTVQDMPGSFATLVKTGNTISGTIKTYTGLYEIRPSASTNLSAFSDVLPQSAGTTVIDQVRTDFKDEAEPTPAPVQVPKKKSSNDLDLAPDTGDDPNKPSVPAKIDVAVFYTGKAETAGGGAAALQSLAVQAVQTLQSSLDAHKVRINVNLVLTAKVDYAETGDVELDRNRLQNPKDGFMDDAIKQRNQVKADLVALIVEDGGPFCGISYIPEDPSLDYADFSVIVVARNCAVGNLSFAHEFGHILGARHDRFVDPTEGKPFMSTHGMIFECGPDVCRDVMAYANFCRDVLSKQCSRLAVWSGVVWLGGKQIPESTNDKDNNSQRALRLSAPVVSKYR
jgi:hypothetical protein